MSRLQPLSNGIEPTAGSTLAHVKTNRLAREEETRQRLARVKAALVLVEQFLLEQGYMNSLHALQKESQVSLSQYCAADNVDLMMVIRDFEQFYEWRYQRRPRLFRPRDGGDASETQASAASGEKMLVRRNRPAHANKVEHLPQQPSTAPPQAQRRAEHGNATKSPAVANDFLNVAGRKMAVPSASPQGEDGHDDYRGRALKPLPYFPTAELNELASAIQRDILEANLAVRWSDVAELDNAKHLLKEAVVMPVRYPELFRGILRPWGGVLLFGPPGTGKTLLAKAVATECRTTFFNVAASTVVSKWRGDSEKLVRMLFELAVHYAPSTIFIDELDALMSARSTEGEHEGSRRMKTELLTQMDGLAKRPDGALVFVLAASNVPWDLDGAVLRRLEKRILVGLPTATARAEMFCRRLGPNACGDLSWPDCAARTEFMSGADIDIVCREALMRPIRKLIAQLEGQTDEEEKLAQTRLEKPKVTWEDVCASIECTRSSVREADMIKYNNWVSKYGSGLSIFADDLVPA